MPDNMDLWELMVETADQLYSFISAEYVDAWHKTILSLLITTTVSFLTKIYCRIFMTWCISRTVNHILLVQSII